jgi:hypothetical protein
MKTPLTGITGIFLVCGLVLPGCASSSRAARKVPAEVMALSQAQGRAQGSAYTGTPPLEPFEIMDYEAKAEGGDIPEWVSRYLAEGVRGVEEIPEFQDKYVFVGLGEGPNFKALSQWEAAFTPAQDLARLVASRIEARLIAAAQTAIPDDTYGAFFETLVKNASNARYQGAVKETSFWVRQFPPVDEAETDEESEEQGSIETDREIYDFLILIGIDRNQLEPQINSLFNAVKTELNPKRDQAAAINRVGEKFFEGF